MVRIMICWLLLSLVTVCAWAVWRHFEKKRERLMIRRRFGTVAEAAYDDVKR